MTSSYEGRDYFSPTEAAKYMQEAHGFGVTNTTICRWCVAGDVAAHKVGGRWRVSRESLDALMLCEYDRPLQREPEEEATQPDAEAPTPTPLPDATPDYERKMLNDYCSDTHFSAVLKGWYDPTPTVPECIAMVHCELSEALECYRDVSGDIGTITTVLGKPEGFPIEIADAVIRLFSLCGHLGIDLDAAVAMKMRYNRTRPWRHGDKRV